MASVKRKDLVDLMAAMGISHNSKISAERAETRVRKYVEKEGVPAGLDDKQTGILRSLGLVSGENKDPVDPAPEEKKARQPRGATAAFVALFPKVGSCVPQSKIVEVVTAAGAQPVTARNYMTWSKRPAVKPKNPLGIRTRAIKDADGTKLLERI